MTMMFVVSDDDDYDDDANPKRKVLDNTFV